MTVRTRFAPSPTGYLHIGGVRTALFCWLFARRHGGQFILRIDDTDQERNVEEALAPILHGLRWLGIDWDEGPEVGGPYGPYYQSQRSSRYQAAVDKLLATGAAYHDFATTEELQAEREAAEREKRVFLYSRRFMAETAADRARFEADGRKSIVRLKMPREGTLVIRDVIRGEVAVDWAREQDHVIQRADGSFLYHLANVVDDYDFKITHVIRAEEHLSNTPRQIFIAQSLSYELPIYAHLPFVAEPGSKTKLSKRKLDKYLKNADFAALMKHGRKVADALKIEADPNTFNPVVVDFYEQVGYLPEAINNYLALLGWSLDDKTEHFSRAELIEHFSLERVNKAAASFDPKKLWAFQDWHMQQLPLEQKVERVIPYLQKAQLVASPPSDQEYSRVEDVVTAAGDRIKTFGDVVDYDYFFLSDKAFRYDQQAVDKRLRTDEASRLLWEFRNELSQLGSFDATKLRLAFRKALESRKGQGSATYFGASTFQLEAFWRELSVAEALSFDEENLERTQLRFISDRTLKMADVIHAVRIAITGKAIGIGLFETIRILGRESTIARIDRTRHEVLGKGQEQTVRHFGHPPLAVSPARDFPDDNSPIELFDGELTVKQGPLNVSGIGKIYLHWLPSPAVRINLTVPQSNRLFLGNDLGEAVVSFGSATAPALITNIETSSHSPAVIRGISNGRFNVGVGMGLSKVKFHVTDFHGYFGSVIRDPAGNRGWAGRLTLNAENWEIVLDAMPDLDKRREYASRNGGYAITHVGQITRRDGADFSATDIQALLETVRLFLTFARGHWVAPLLATGYDPTEKIVWEDWTLWRFSSAEYTGSWFPVHSLKDIPSFFSEFHRRAIDPSWKEWIHTAIYWYIKSNEISAVDVGIVTTQIVLELAAEFAMSHLNTEQGCVHDKSDPMAMINWLLTMIGAPKEIPPELESLKRVSAEYGIESAPTLLREIRNGYVHPKVGSNTLFSRVSRDGRAIWEASRLGQLYSDLALLWLFGYKGGYQNRARAKHVWEIEEVPWEKPMEFLNQDRVESLKQDREASSKHS